MTFNEVMALIMPSLIALLFYSKVTNSNLTVMDGICHSAFFMLCTNCLCYAILTFLKIEVIIFTVAFTIKYCLMAVCVAFVIAVLYRLIELNIKIKIRVELLDEKEQA